MALANRRGSRPGLETLEGRALLSGGTAPGRAGQTIGLANLQPVYSQADSAITLTVVRAAPAFGSIQVEVSTSKSLKGAGSALAGVQYQAVDQVVTFGRGETSKTLSIPIIVGASNPGQVTVNVGVIPLTPNVVNRVDATIQIDRNGDFTPPRIVSTRLISTSLAPEGLALTFSKPMDPASVTRLAAYRVTNISARVNPGAFSANDAVWSLFGGKSRRALSTIEPVVPLKSAAYDPSTNTVILIPSRPIAASGLFLVESSGASSATSLRDKSGNNMTGTFAVSVHRANSTGGKLSPPPVKSKRFKLL